MHRCMHAGVHAPVRWVQRWGWDPLTHEVPMGVLDFLCRPLHCACGAWPSNLRGDRHHRHLSGMDSGHHAVHRHHATLHPHTVHTLTAKGMPSDPPTSVGCSLSVAEIYQRMAEHTQRTTEKYRSGQPATTDVTRPLAREQNRMAVVDHPPPLLCGRRRPRGQAFMGSRVGGFGASGTSELSFPITQHCHKQ